MTVQLVPSDPPIFNWASLTEEQRKFEIIKAANFCVYSTINEIRDELFKMRSFKEREAIENVRKQVFALIESSGIEADRVFEYTEQPKKETRRKADIKYRNPNNLEETWSGRGAVPIKWVQKIMKDRGITKEEFLQLKEFQVA